MARRRYQKGSLFLRGKNPVWVGRWLEDVMDANGNITRLHKSEVIGTKSQFPSQRLARREFDIRLSRINSLTYQPQRVIGFADFAERWKRNVLVTYKPSTQSAMRSCVKRLSHQFGHLQLSNITTEMLQGFLSDVKVKPKTVYNLFITFKLMWKTAKAWGYTEKNICEGIVRPKMNEPEVKTFTPEHMKQIIVAAKEPYKTMFWVVAECGIRGAELCALQLADLDLTQNTIVVRRSVWKGKAQTTKTKKGVRKFAISMELSEHLRTFLSNHHTANPEKWLFATREGTAYDNRDIVDQVLHPILERLNIPRAGLHAFRHGNSSLMDHLCIPMGVRRDRLGHEKTDTTMGYTHTVGNDDRLTANKIGRILCPNLLNSQPVETANN